MPQGEQRGDAGRGVECAGQKEWKGRRDGVGED